MKNKEYKIKLHIDTDLGGDIDDLCALAMVLNMPGVDLLAVTTNSDDKGKRAGYTRYTLELAGRRDIPVAAGADISSTNYRVTPGLPDENAYWPEPIPPAFTPVDQALSLLERSIEQGAAIVAVGAYTNLALLEKRSPGILSRARLYLMGGYIFPIREGFPSWGNDMDWNIQVDVDSAYHVLQHLNPTLIPLTVTVETSLRRSHLRKLRQAGPVGQLIARQAEAFAIEEKNEEKYGRVCKGLPGDIINFLHDPLACAVASGWNDGVLIEEIPLKFEIKDGWLQEKIDESGKPTRVVTKIDGNKFNEFWLNTIIRKNHV